MDLELEKLLLECDKAMQTFHIRYNDFRSHQREPNADLENLMLTWLPVAEANAAVAGSIGDIQRYFGTRR